MEQIMTDRLILRKFRETDFEDLYEFLAQQKDAAFEAYPNIDAETCKEQLEKRLTTEEFYAVELKKTGKVIGNIYFADREHCAKEVGFLINQDYRRQGYALEALRAVTTAALRGGIHRVYAECDPRNISSWGLLERANFRREGCFRQFISFRKDAAGKPIWSDTYVYAMLEEDLPAPTPSGTESTAVRYPFRGLILRDYQESDIDDDIYWSTGHHPWMDWDAPWEPVEMVDPEAFRAESMAHIAAKKSTPRWRLQIEAEGARIGFVSSYRIGEDFGDVSAEEAKTKKWFRAVGIDILDDRFWGKGYGTTALEAWLHYLIDNGLTELYLQTWSGNTRMVHVAEKLGFAECSRRVGLREWQGRRYDALTFRLDLETFFKEYENPAC